MHRTVEGLKLVPLVRVQFVLFQYSGYGIDAMRGGRWLFPPHKKRGERCPDPLGTALEVWQSTPSTVSSSSPKLNGLGGGQETFGREVGSCWGLGGVCRRDE